MRPSSNKIPLLSIYSIHSVNFFGFSVRICRDLQIIVTFLCLSGLLSTAHAEAAECNLRATARVFSNLPAIKDYYFFKTSPRLSFRMPRNFNKIIYSSGFIHVVYPDNRLVSFRVVTIDDYALVKGYLSVAVIPKLLFDFRCKELKRWFNGSIRSRLIKEKRDYLRNVKEVFHVIHGDHEYYYFSRKDGRKVEHYAFILHRNIKSSFQVVVGRNFSLKAFLSMMF